MVGDPLTKLRRGVARVINLGTGHTFCIRYIVCRLQLTLPAISSLLSSTLKLSNLDLDPELLENFQPDLLFLERLHHIINLHAAKVNRA